MSPYAVAKRTGELYASVLAPGINTVGLRYMNAYGPRQDPSSPYSGVISIWIEQLLKEQTPVIFGDGKNTRDFVFVDDIVQANILAAMMEKRPPGEENIFNIGTGTPTTLETLLQILGRTIRESGGEDLTLAPRYMPARAGDIKHSRADITLAQNTLGYEPRYGLAEGLKKTNRTMEG